MNIKESLPHALGRKTLDAMIRYYRSKNRAAHTAKRHGGRS